MIRRPLPGLRSAAALAVGTVVCCATTVAVPADAHPARGADPVGRLLASMTLEQKVGQLFVTYAYGATADTTDPAAVAQNRQLYGVDNGAQLVARYSLGGVIYFTWANDLSTPAAVATLSNGYQQAAAGSGAGVPLLTTIDQEGGWVARLTAPVAVSPSNMALGAGFAPRLAYDTNRATGQQLKALGINVDDAPVVDTNTNPNNTADGTRSFGDTATQTSLFGAASVRGLQSSGVSATAKHFPGLGSTSVNTDYGVATSGQTRAQFERNDLPAFRAAVAAGTDEIMAAHIVAPGLDPTGTPASLSAPMITGILRQELHYDGVVITDALSAAALHDYTDAQRAVLAIKAGVDQLLMPTSLPTAVQAVLDAVHDGTLSQARIDQSVRRILTLKRNLGLLTGAVPQVDVAAAASSVGTPSQTAAMATAAAHGVTLYRNTAGVLPLTAGSSTRVLVTGYGVTTTTTLAADIAAQGVTVSKLTTGSAPDAPTIASAVAAAKGVDYTVVVSNDAWNAPQQRALISALQADGTPTIVLATGAPYELGFLPDTPTFLASFSYQPAGLQAATDVLFGAQPLGRSPVTVRTPDGRTVVAPLGSGLRY